MVPVSDRIQLKRAFWQRSVLLLCLSISFSNAAHFRIGFAAQDERDSRFEEFLGKLSRSHKQSILTARQEFLNRYSASRGEVQADAFRLFLAFYRDVIRTCDDEFYRNENLQKLLHLVADETGTYRAPLAALAKSKTSAVSELKIKYQRELKQLEEFRECGIDFIMSEGDWYLEEDADFLLNSTTSLVGEYRDYVLFYTKESRQRLVEDAALLISWEDLGRRISRWEQFARDHSSLPEIRTEVEPQIRRMMSWYLLGIDNTPAYDFSKKGAIDPKLFQSYATFLSENSASRYSKLISRIHESLKRSQGRMSPEVLDLLKGANFRNSRLEREAAKLFSKPSR